MNELQEVLIVTDHNDGIWLFKKSSNWIKDFLEEFERVKGLDLAKLVGILVCLGARWNPKLDEIPEYFMWLNHQKNFSECATIILNDDQKPYKKSWSPAHNFGEYVPLWKWLKERRNINHDV